MRARGQEEAPPLPPPTHMNASQRAEKKPKGGVCAKITDAKKTQSKNADAMGDDAKPSDARKIIQEICTKTRDATLFEKCAQTRKHFRDARPPLQTISPRPQFKNFSRDTVPLIALSFTVGICFSCDENALVIY